MGSEGKRRNAGRAESKCGMTAGDRKGSNEQKLGREQHLCHTTIAGARALHVHEAACDRGDILFLLSFWLFDLG